MAEVSISASYRGACAECMRTPEAARYMALSESTLTKMRLTGDGPPFVKVGPRAIAYRKADLNAYIAARVCRSTSDEPMAA
jgi:predicted DNA-binding transcriptional regulator AlpA